MVSPSFAVAPLPVLRSFVTSFVGVPLFLTVTDSLAPRWTVIDELFFLSPPPRPPLERIRHRRLRARVPQPQPPAAPRAGRVLRRAHVDAAGRDRRARPGRRPHGRRQGRARPRRAGADRGRRADPTLRPLDRAR